MIVGLQKQFELLQKNAALKEDDSRLAHTRVKFLYAYEQGSDLNAKRML